MDQPVSLQARRIDLRVELGFDLGPARVDPAAHEITIDGSTQRLQPQMLKVLIALHDKRNEVVSREELTDRCWDGRIVGEDVINRCISLLRRLADETGAFRIETIRRAGYRLTEIQGAMRRGKPWRPAIAAGLGLLLLGGGGWYLYERGGDKDDKVAPTVAVLPIAENSQGRDVHELAAATYASLSSALTHGGYPVAVVEGGAKHPDLLVSGEVHRLGSSAEAYVQVEDTRHHVVVYNQRFEADEKSAAALPDRIGASVAANLSSATTLLKLDRRHPSDPAVTAALLNAASIGEDGQDSLKAYEVARRLASRSPNSAIAQFMLASEAGNSFGDLPREQREAAVKEGRAAADRLLVLAPDFGEAYALSCPLHSSIHIIECENQARRGLAVDPDAPSLASDLAALLNSVGRVEEALELDQVEFAKDPYNPGKLGRMIRLLEETGDTKNAERLYRQAIRWWPDSFWINWSRVVGIEARGDYSELERFANEVDGDKLPLDRPKAAKVIAAARAHDRDGLKRACETEGLRWTNLSLCMTTLADAGEMDQAFAIANKLFPPLRGRNAADEERIWLDQPSAFSIAVLSSPAAASLRRDPSFLPLVDGFGLLAYWRSGRLPDFCRVKHEPVCAKIVRAS
jgi:tetratricopeptide (TPR) repeat protein